MAVVLVRCPNCWRDIAVAGDAQWHASIVHYDGDQPSERVVRDDHGKVLHSCPIRLAGV
jgi:hypothetical protein